MKTWSQLQMWFIQFFDISMAWRWMSPRGSTWHIQSTFAALSLAASNSFPTEGIFFKNELNAATFAATASSKGVCTKIPSHPPTLSTTAISNPSSSGETASRAYGSPFGKLSAVPFLTAKPVLR